MFLAAKTGDIDHKGPNGLISGLTWLGIVSVSASSIHIIGASTSISQVKYL